jgi:hypothetical protein
MDPFLGAGAIVLLYVVLLVAVIAAWFQGLILTFRANVILGVVCLLLHAPLVLIGVIYWLFDFNIPQALMDALRK